jgi:hypothetical protein
MLTCERVHAGGRHLGMPHSSIWSTLHAGGPTFTIIARPALLVKLGCIGPDPQVLSVRPQERLTFENLFDEPPDYRGQTRLLHCPLTLSLRVIAKALFA